MTLNVTILTPATIYQSADFRLTESGKLITEPSFRSTMGSQECLRVRTVPHLQSVLMGR